MWNLELPKGVRLHEHRPRQLLVAGGSASRCKCPVGYGIVDYGQPESPPAAPTASSRRTLRDQASLPGAGLGKSSTARD